MRRQLFELIVSHESRQVAEKKKVAKLFEYVIFNSILVLMHDQGINTMIFIFLVINEFLFISYLSYLPK